MTPKEFNDYGSRYGYPIYVFADGTYGSIRDSRKNVLFTVEGKIDTNPAHQRQLTSNSGNVPARQTEVQPRHSGSFWDRIFGKASKPKAEKQEPVDVEYEEIPRTDVVHKQSQNNQAAVYDNSLGNGKFHHKGKDWEISADGVKEVKTFHAKEGDKEVFVANYRF